jgi:pilus assembly protein CpaC
MEPTMGNPISIKRSLMSIAVLILLVFPAAQNAYSAGQCANLQKLQLNTDCTSIMIGLDGAIKTKSFILENPARWVLDIWPAKWTGDIPKKIIPGNDMYFSQIRIGQWQSQTARLVVHNKGKIPKVDITDSTVMILFEDQKETPLINESIPQLPVPDNLAEKPESEKVVEISRLLATDNSAEGKVVTIPRIQKAPSTEVLPATDILSANPIGKNQFDIQTDGTSTIIAIPLNGDKSFNVRREKFPDRLTIEYPSRNNIKNIRFTTKGKENMPCGVIEYVNRFESVNPNGYNKLVFYASDKFTYKTDVLDGNLQVTITGKSQAVANTELTVAETTKSASDIKPVSKLTVEIPKVVTADTGTSVNLLEGPTKSDDTTKSVETQKFTPPDRKSFIIDNKTTDGEHTTPEVGLGIRLNKVEIASDPIGTSISELKEILPKMAEPRLTEDAKVLESIADNSNQQDRLSGPVMIEPPTDMKSLPKGTRPAADLFLIKGESAILPVSNLVRASVGNPDVLVVNVLSQEELLITAKGEGQTTLILWEDGIGRSVRWVNVGKSSLMRTIEVERIINDPDIKVSFVGETTVVIEGKVKTEEQLKRAALIASGAAEKVVNLIEMTDPKQVLVKVRFVEIQTKDKNELLRQFGSGTRTESGDFQFNILSDILDPETGSGGIFDISLHPGIIHGGSGDELFDPLDLMLSSLEQNRRGKILSQPNIVALSGHDAKFRVGGEVPYTYQNEKGVNVVDFREFGVELNVTPYVDSNNNINMKVFPVVRVPDFTLAISGIPGFKTREVQTDIQVGDGQTIVIGGLLQHETTSIKSKVPLFGDIPLVGELFRSKRETDEETELLIFLTPMVLKDISTVESHITDDTDVSLSPYYKKEIIEGMKEED